MTTVPSQQSHGVRTLLDQCAAGHAALENQRETVFLRCEAPVLDLAPLEWLEAQTGFPRLYWSGRDGYLEAACLGAADTFTSGTPASTVSIMHTLHQKLSRAKKARYFGHLCFDQEGSRGGEWSGFGAFRFTLPRFELIREGRSLKLVFNTPVKAGQSREAFLEQNRRVLSSLKLGMAGPASLSGARVLPLPKGEAGRWQESVRAVLKDIAAGNLEKAVLARTRHITFDIAPSPLTFIRCFRQMKSPAYFFSFQYGPKSVFLGSSPEQLFRRDNTQLASDALAGTRPRGKTPAQDAALRSSLVSAPKDRLEHQFVEAHIRRKFEVLCNFQDASDQPEVLQLVKVQHLIKRIRGKLKPGTSDADILAALHPTPAVAGTPISHSMALIKSLERFDRGLYCGPIGWVGAQASEFAVAIRSGLLAGNRLTLYSGAGIVHGSQPEMEWAETQNKFEHFIQVIGL